MKRCCELAIKRQYTVYNYSMWEEDIYGKFICPLCKSDRYVRVKVQKPNGHWYTTEFYKCFGCSVMFADARDFSNCKRLVVGESVDMLRSVNMTPPGEK